MASRKAAKKATTRTRRPTRKAKAPARKGTVVGRTTARAVAAGSGDCPEPDPAAVDAFLRQVGEPQRAILQRLRAIVLGVDARVAEHIKWNHPAFYYTGPMRPFAPKEYRRHMIVSNLHSKGGGVLLVFWRGAGVGDTSGFLTGDYADGRRLARFHTLADVDAGAAALRRVVARWIEVADA